MNLNIKLLLASTSLLASATGCIGGSGQPLNNNTAATVIASVATNALNKLPTSSNAPSLPTSLSGVSTSALNLRTKAAGCETITPSPLVDADNDGISAEKKYVFDCTDFESLGTTFSRKGYIKIVDKDDSVADLLGGLRVDYDITSFKTTNTNGDITDYSFSGFWDYEASATKMASASEFEGHFLSNSASNNFDIDYLFKYTWNYTMVPDDVNNFFTTGSIDFTGTFSMDGEFYTEDDNNNHQSYNGNWEISYYSENLLYDSTCAKWYNSGSIKMEDGSGVIYELRYSCDSAKFYIDGKESDLYKP